MRNYVAISMFLAAGALLVEAFTSFGQKFPPSATPNSLPVSAMPKIGDGTVDGTKLAPYDNAWVVTERFPDGKIVEPGIWTDQLRLREINGRKVFVRTQGLAYFDGRVITSVNVFDPVTFAPISSVLHNPDGSVEKWTINGTNVESHITEAGRGEKEIVKKFETATPCYDFNCCMRSLIAAALPLREGYSVSLPAIVSAPGDDAVVTYKVLKCEMIQAGARGMVNTWLVETLAPGGCDCAIRFWISDKPPFIIRMTLSPGKGHEYEQSFDMLK